MSQETLDQKILTIDDVETLILELIETIDEALSFTGSRDTVPTRAIVNVLLDARLQARHLLDVDLKKVEYSYEEDSPDTA